MAPLQKNVEYVFPYVKQKSLVNIRRKFGEHAERMLQVIMLPARDYQQSELVSLGKKITSKPSMSQIAVNNHSF
jgi:hypothetical protein